MYYIIILHIICRQDQNYVVNFVLLVGYAMIQYSIEFDHVFAGYGKKIILYDISLKIKKGDIVAVIGNSGAGKSTGIRCMTAQIIPKAGTAKTSGIDVHETELVQASIGYVPQLEYISLYMDFSAIKNALFFGRNYGLSDDIIKKRCKEVMAILGLENEEYLTKKVKFLSGGEKKRVSIMIGLISDPEILFLDEPTTGLDPHLRIEVLNFLFKINQTYNTTMILVSHDLECVDYCSNVLIFAKGFLVDRGNPHDLIDNLPNHGKAFDIQFRELSLDEENKIISIEKILHILHVGRNKFRIFIAKEDDLESILETLDRIGLKIITCNPIDATFLDYFRLQSKYTYGSKFKNLLQKAKNRSNKVNI